MIQSAKIVSEKVNDKLYQIFLRIADDKQEIDWRALKNILDFYTKADSPSIKSATLEKIASNPNEQHSESSNHRNILLVAILRICCGVFCKNTQFQSVVDQNNQNSDLMFAETKGKGFSKDMCRSMISMLDDDKSGKLGFDEFLGLWQTIKIWKDIFNSYDKDQTGTFSGYELRKALASSGYQLNTPVLNAIMRRYGNASGEIEFDDFIMCTVKLKIMFDIFNRKDSNKTNTASFNLDEWLENTIKS